jgi:hypothetical protein
MIAERSWTSKDRETRSAERAKADDPVTASFLSYSGYTAG